MAVRRISDLPNLVTYYEDVDLHDTLVEVSYAKPGDPRRYQSFYAKLSDVMNQMVAEFPRATKTQFGVVKIGNNINVVETETDDKGLISVPFASNGTPGVVKIGSGVNVDNNGIISVTPVPYASKTKAGIVKIGTNINVDANGLISVPTATASDLGVVRVQNGNGLAIDNGVISMTQPSTIGIQPVITDGLTIAYITANNQTYAIQQKRPFNTADIDYFNVSGQLKTIKIPSTSTVFGKATILNLRMPFDCWVRISNGDSDGALESNSVHYIYNRINMQGNSPNQWLSFDGVPSFNAGQFMFFAQSGSRYFIKGITTGYANAASAFMNSHASFVRLYPLIGGKSESDWNWNTDIKMISQLKSSSSDAFKYLWYTNDGNAWKDSNGNPTTQIGRAQRYWVPPWNTNPWADPTPA